MLFKLVPGGFSLLTSNKLQQFKFKLEKIIGMQEKLEKSKIFRMVCICINLEVTPPLEVPRLYINLTMVLLLRLKCGEKMI